MSVLPIWNSVPAALPRNPSCQRWCTCRGATSLGKACKPDPPMMKHDWPVWQVGSSCPFSASLVSLQSFGLVCVCPVRLDLPAQCFLIKAQSRPHAVKTSWTSTDEDGRIFQIQAAGRGNLTVSGRRGHRRSRKSICTTSIVQVSVLIPRICILEITHPEECRLVARVLSYPGCELKERLKKTKNGEGLAMSGRSSATCQGLDRSGGL